MPDYVVLLSLPGLRQRDLARLPALASLMSRGDCAPLAPSFPAVTGPVQANMLTGRWPRDHGVVANGFYWRDRREIQMWTAGNEVVQAPQIWDLLHAHDASLTSAAWFPMLGKGSGADMYCVPDLHDDSAGAVSCSTRPAGLYAELCGALGKFPARHLRDPSTNVPTTAWIVASAIHAAERMRPHFLYLSMPTLDYAAQVFGPDSAQAVAALDTLDGAISRLVAGLSKAYAGERLLWLAASEYVITPVRHVSFPNRRLREAGLLEVRVEADGEHLDLEQSAAWALVDHQFSHVFVNGGDEKVISRVVDLFRNTEGIDAVLAGESRAKHGLDHPRSGEVVLVSTPDSWQAYFWWLDGAKAPLFASTVDIARKPGYDPLELCVDSTTQTVPLDPLLIRGSHGAPAQAHAQRGVLLSSDRGVLVERATADTDVADLVLRQYGI